MYMVFKKVMVWFLVAYSVLFVGTHTMSLVIGELWTKDVKYFLMILGQTFVLVSFTILSYKLTDQLKKVYSELASTTLRLLLILISFLLFTRIVLAILNFTKITRKYKGRKYFFLYTLVSLLTFEIAPTIALVALSTLQDNQRKKMMEAGENISELLEDLSKTKENINESEAPANAILEDASNK
eukprot:TRINITY_DN8861_c0_g1_i6.p1 TRINITY_DN8861_c0_g1~~TRINITY_DN8861_c0_g1_i6.p1  ORF type:complete len:184 (-),score=43.85 TRINITY_DN8861_c0_g1_i6:196-747(-)